MSKQKPPSTRKKPTGPEPETLKLEGEWEKRMAEAVRKPRPEKGWPKNK